MSKRGRSGLMNFDWVVLSLFIGLLAIGWTMIFAVGYDSAKEGNIFGNYIFNLQSIVGKQTLWIAVAFLILTLTSFVDEKFWNTFAYPVYGLSLLLLLLVLVAGTEIKGARSWFTFGGFSLQPAELAKFGTSLCMAAYLSTFSTDLRKIQHQAISAGIFLAPVLLILLQPDAGSALVFLSFLMVMYREGMSRIWYVLGFSAIALFVLSLIFGYQPVWWGLLLFSLGVLAFDQTYSPTRWRVFWFALIAGSGWTFFGGWQWESLGVLGGLLLIGSLYQWRYQRGRLIGPLLTLVLLGGAFAFATHFAFENVLKPHQQDRINVWLRPSLSDPSGSAYNLEHSKMAIGSGGFLGKGFLQGTMTKGNYVPEQSTDFIFCTIGEEQGFLGSLLVIVLFCLLLLRILLIAERQKTDFARLYAYGVAGIIFVHFMVNIGMTMGLMPIIGIPLPFVSYGGSSLMGFSLMIGVLLKIDSDRFST